MCDAGGVQNNGNVGSMTDTVQNITYDYTYDQLNRIDTAMASGNEVWSQDFDYDTRGNMWLASVVNTPQVVLTGNSFDESNQITEAGYTYDAAGNMTGSPDLSANYVYKYDAENRLINVKLGATVLGLYTYDGDGNRAIKTIGTDVTAYHRGLGGVVLAELLNGVVERHSVYLGGQELATVKTGEGWRYNFTDHLGTLRLRAYANGNVQTRHDFYPFGGEHDPTATDEKYKFTGQERDDETGLDYFIARHYASYLGRFMQPDAPFLDQVPGDPQSWNIYTYVRNNPLNFVDPTGQATHDQHFVGDHCQVPGPQCAEGPHVIASGQETQATDDQADPADDAPGVAQNLDSYVQGIGNAYGSNALGMPRAAGGDAFFQAGQEVGDVISLFTGIAETFTGGNMILIGVTETLVTIPIAETGAPALGIAVAVAGTGVALHGTMTTGNALDNILQRRSSRGGGHKRKKQSTGSKGRTGQYHGKRKRPKGYTEPGRVRKRGQKGPHPPRQP